MKIQTRKNLIWFAFWVIAFAFTFGIWILLINYDLFRKLFILPVIVVVFGLILVSLKLKNIKIKSISKALKETKTWKSFGKNLWEKKWKYLLVTIIIVGVGAALYFPLYWDVILPNEGIYLDKPVNELEDDIYGNPSYYPKPQEPTHLYSINTSDCQGEELVTIMSLQGVLAKDKPRIYISDDNYYAKWLNLIKAEGVSVTEEQDPWALVDQFSSDVEGYIIYSAEGGNAEF